MAVTRLGPVSGYKRATNDVLHGFVPPFDGAVPSSPLSLPPHVVFFSGDAQNYAEHMRRGNVARFAAFSLDATCEQLAARYPGHHVWMVRPSRFHEGLYAVWDHFVHTVDVFGRPDGADVVHVTAWLHLATLLHGAHRRVPGAAPLADGVALVAFSKGTVVLDQLVAEVPLLRGSGMPPNRAATAARALLSAVRVLHYVDGIAHAALFQGTSLVTVVRAGAGAGAGAGVAAAFSPTTVMPPRGAMHTAARAPWATPDASAAMDAALDRAWGAAVAADAGRSGPPAAAGAGVTDRGGNGGDAGGDDCDGDADDDGDGDVGVDTDGGVELPPLRTVRGVCVANMPALFGPEVAVVEHGSPYQWSSALPARRRRRACCEAFTEAVRSYGGRAVVMQYFDGDAGPAKGDDPAAADASVIKHHFGILAVVDLNPSLPDVAVP